MCSFAWQSLHSPLAPCSATPGNSAESFSLPFSSGAGRIPYAEKKANFVHLALAKRLLLEEYLSSQASARRAPEQAWPYTSMLPTIPSAEAFLPLHSLEEYLITHVFVRRSGFRAAVLGGGGRCRVRPGLCSRGIHRQVNFLAQAGLRRRRRRLPGAANRGGGCFQGQGCNSRRRAGPWVGCFSHLSRSGGNQAIHAKCAAGPVVGLPFPWGARRLPVTQQPRGPFAIRPPPSYPPSGIPGGTSG